MGKGVWHRVTKVWRYFRQDGDKGTIINHYFANEETEQRENKWLIPDRIEKCLACVRTCY